MIYEILCNGKVHYTRPHDHPDVQEALDLIWYQKLHYGVTSYEVRPTQGALDSGYCNCKYPPFHTSFVNARPGKRGRSLSASTGLDDRQPQCTSAAGRSTHHRNPTCRAVSTFYPQLGAPTMSIQIVKHTPKIRNKGEKFDIFLGQQPAAIGEVAEIYDAQGNVLNIGQVKDLYTKDGDLYATIKIIA